MRRELGFEQIVRTPQSVMTVGTFDGVHRGHQTILSHVRQRAEALEGVSTLVTFDPHPRTIVKGEVVPLLTTIEERAAVVEELDIDRLAVIPFTRSFAKLSPEAFVKEILVDRIGLQEIIVGYDHRFGRGGQGDVDTLRRLGEKHGFAVGVISAQALGDQVMSSSKLRQLLAEEGDVQAAERMLGRLYRMHGRVVKGEGRGRSIGYPTANLEVDRSRKLIPRRGVYAVKVTRIESSGEPTYGGMMNIGYRPTFSDEETLVPEVHLFDCSDMLYGEILRIEFAARIRDEISFGSVDELVKQLEDDEVRCKEALEVIF